jgi:AcrR family transcriptional regulator
MKYAKRRYVMTARAASAEATRNRIRASAAALYGERAIEDFTLEEVARRAGTTVQTVLRAYGSKDELIWAALFDLAKAGMPVKSTIAGDVGAAVKAIYDIYETVGDLVIRRLGEEERHPLLKPALEEGRKNHREGVRRAFAPQLERLSGAARAQLFNILLVATDVYVWKLLRRDRGLGRAAAEALVCQMINAVTATEGENGKDLVVELVGRREPAS